jgi:hypothetical protein
MLAALAEFFETPGAARSRGAPDYVREHGLNLEEFRAFGRHLDISRILNKHGVARPLALFRDRLADRGEIAKVFEAMTRRAEGARPPLDQDGWRAVLRDLQRLQKLIPVVPIQDVFFRSAAFGICKLVPIFLCNSYGTDVFVIIIYLKGPLMFLYLIS